MSNEVNLSVNNHIEKSFQERRDSDFYFFLEKDFVAFMGHFPDAPLLPGIVQVDMVLFCLKKILNRDIKLKEIKKIKFIKPILPETQFIISIAENGEKFNAVIKNNTDDLSQIQVII